MNCGNPLCTIKCHHRRKETGPGWAKCLDCGAGYGWPGILPGPAAQPAVEVAEGDVVTIVLVNEAL